MSKRSVFVLTTALFLSCMPMFFSTGCASQAAGGESAISLSFKSRLHNLAPYVPLQAPERYYAETVMEFIPSNNYGRVYPYPALVDSMYGDHLVYGFVDQNGRVVCDPAYYNVYLTSFGDQPVYFVSGMRKVGIDYSFDDFNGAGSLISFVVSQDGSFYDMEEDAVRQFGLRATPPPQDRPSVDPDPLHPLKGFEEANFERLQWIGDYYLAADKKYGGLLREDGAWFVKFALEDINSLVND